MNQNPWIAQFCENDDPYGEVIRIAIEGTEYGWVGCAEDGSDLDLMPTDTVEEARADIDYLFGGWSTFQWLDED